MRELAQHITDLVENSVRAGARRVDIEVEEDLPANTLVIRVADDGSGMTPEMAARVVDPFYTSRTCRKVGLGLPLVAATAERCGGSLEIASDPGHGTTVTVRMRRDHIDRPPLGDLRATLLGAIVGHPDVELRYRHRVDGQVFELDGAEIRRELENVPISHPSVLRWLDRCVTEGLAELGVQSSELKEGTDAQDH